MKDNLSTWVFGAIGAIAGFVYLYQARHPQPAPAPVTNVFPPLNTDDGALSDYQEPQATATAGMSGTTAPVNTPTIYYAQVI
jgi:hypothetical protein